MYFDEEVSKSEKHKIEKHVDQCEFCRNRLHQFQSLRSITHKGADPRPNRDLWPPIREQINEMDKNTSEPFIFTNRIITVLAVITVLAGSWLITGSFTSDQKSESNTPHFVNQFAFDYGLYLSGLENPDLMNDFNRGYKRYEANIMDSLESDRHNRLLSKLPQHISVVSKYLLTSACCYCNQYTLEHNGKQVTIFQQPKKHPVEFSGFHKEHAEIEGKNCSKIEAENHTALAFESGDSKYVVVGKKNDPVLSTIMHRITEGHE